MGYPQGNRITRLTLTVLGAVAVMAQGTVARADDPAPAVNRLD
jgi:hypothetical protein